MPLSPLARLVCVLVAAGAPLAAAEPVAYDPERFEALHWRNIGPFRGGRSVAATGVASDPRTYYFGGVGGGVWKTTTGGETWINVSDEFFATSSVGAIAVAPSDPNVIYVGMGEHAIRGVMTSQGDGVYRSTDAGRTWSHVGLADTRAISRIRVHPAEPDHVYVAAQGAPFGPREARGVYRSTDGGATWTKVLYVSKTTGAADLAMDPSNPRILYAAMWDHERKPWEVRSGGPGSGLHKSTDGGDTWTKLEKGLPDPLGKLSVDVSADSDRLYAIVEADPGGGLYRSDDAGESWKLVNDTWGIRSRAWYYIEVYADPRNSNVVWVMNARAWRSIDGGKTFEQVATPHGDNHDLWINPNDPSILINANDGGANVSFDAGATWSTQRNQPTAQFYRVATDNRFPYRVYGGQQDNSTVSIASRTFDRGIDWSDFHSVGGCESAFTGFDPDDPELVYAGCYMGQISEWTRRTDSTRNVMAYPDLPAALPPRDVKYRFNWNAPIVVSQHDPSVVYHAGNVVLKTTDRGRSWTEVSPDLTRDDDEKQGPGGRPITNEGAGGETYNTIAYLAESPHDARTLWAGTDDGLVQLTRDGGETWRDVTPPGIGEALVNAVELSPHAAGTAYVAVTRYKFDDLAPHAFKTTDSGATWTSIAAGIPEGAWVRVVREDPVRPGLLYMGTETGVFVSFDAGGSWSSLRLDLPVTPITDLTIRSNDLVAATAGRAFWILDDLSPLQQLAETDAAARAHLFNPRDAVRAYAGGFGEPGPRVGENPPPGAIVDFLLARTDAAVKLEILDAAGDVIRRYVGETEAEKDEREKKKEKPDPNLPDRFVVRAGLNRTSWDLRHEAVTRVPGLYVFGALRGRKVVPGEYRVRLRVGDEAFEAPLRVVPDPRLEAGGDDYVAQAALSARISEELDAIHTAVNRLREVRGQIEALLKRLGDAGDEQHERIRAAGKGIAENLTAVEDALIQKRTVDGQTVINFPVRLNHHYIYLLGAVDGADAGVTAGAERRLADLSARWAEQKAALDDLLGEKLAAFNQLVDDAGVPAIGGS